METQPNMRSNSIEISQISKSYEMGTIKVHALKNASLKIEQNEFIIILGPSGSGKTTLLNLIGAIDSPTTGQIQVFGNNLTNSSRKQLAKFRRENLGFIFQFFNLIPTLTAKENIEFALQIGNQDYDLEQSTRVLDLVGLTERYNHFPSEMSGGEQQRVAIARAISKSPKLILADEPTGELDFETGIKILEILNNLSKSGQTVIMVTHNSEIAKIGTRIIKLRSGEIISDELNHNPINPNELRW